MDDCVVFGRARDGIILRFVQRCAERFGAFNVCCEFFGQVIVFDDARVALSDDACDRRIVEVYHMIVFANLLKRVFSLSHRKRLLKFERSQVVQCFGWMLLWL
jgi:hypothetical protein